MARYDQLLTPVLPPEGPGTGASGYPARGESYKKHANQYLPYLLAA